MYELIKKLRNTKLLKINILQPLIQKRTCAYQGVKSILIFKVFTFHNLWMVSTGFKAQSLSLTLIIKKYFAVKNWKIEEKNCLKWFFGVLYFNIACQNFLMIGFFFYRNNVNKNSFGNLQNFLEENHGQYIVFNIFP